VDFFLFAALCLLAQNAFGAPIISEMDLMAASRLPVLNQKSPINLAVLSGRKPVE
jgi:hypothetical protein